MLDSGCSVNVIRIFKVGGGGGEMGGACGMCGEKEKYIQGCGG
jgi:hypothetical protein